MKPELFGRVWRCLIVTVYEGLTIALDVVLAAATTVALYYGLLGMARQSVRGDRMVTARADGSGRAAVDDEELSRALRHSRSI